MFRFFSSTLRAEKDSKVKLDNKPAEDWKFSSLRMEDINENVYRE